jgi:SAM-dependent methyltransferase
MTLKTQIRHGIRNVLPRPALMALKRVAFKGSAHTCVVCGSNVSRMLDQGYGYPILEELRVVGGMRKANDECPICRANDRIRLVHLYTHDHSDMLAKPNRLLHIAPELGLADIWSRIASLDYMPADPDRRRYRHLKGLQTFDLQAAPFPDRNFDWIICNHVLEHIPDDRRAIAEIFRMLKPGGTAILQVPISLVRARTDEDPSIADPAERIRRFGQSDHIRLYARDYYDRLRDAGFEVELWDAFATDPEHASAWHLNPLEKLTLARRPR